MENIEGLILTEDDESWYSQAGFCMVESVINLFNGNLLADRGSLKDGPEAGSTRKRRSRPRGCFFLNGRTDHRFKTEGGKTNGSFS